MEMLKHVVLALNKTLKIKPRGTNGPRCLDAGLTALVIVEGVSCHVMS